jgi:RNA polymerase sigma-70 factor (ECF subfamily)
MMLGQAQPSSAANLPSEAIGGALRFGDFERAAAVMRPCLFARRGRPDMSENRASTIQRILGDVPRLRRFARFLTRDVNRADELVEACLERSLATPDIGRDDEDVRVRLFSILRDVFVNDFREESLYSSSSGIEFAALNAPVIRKNGHLVLSTLEQAVLNLPIELREVLALVTIERLTYEQAAEVVGISTEVIRSRLSRARIALGEMLDRPDTQFSAK